MSIFVEITAGARAIRHAEASDKVRRNVAALVDSPSGRQGRPSRSLTFEQAVALIAAAQEYALYAYVVLSLLVGLRTEEARALRWDHMHLDADPALPPYVDVWRSIRAHPGASPERYWAAFGAR
jgi:integrase